MAGSNIEEEFDEMLLKANRLITTICESTVSASSTVFCLPSLNSSKTLGGKQQAAFNFGGASKQVYLWPTFVSSAVW